MEFYLIPIIVFLAVFFAVYALLPEDFSLKLGAKEDKYSPIDNNKIIQWLSKLNQRIVWRKYSKKYQRKFVLSGLPGKMAPEEFMALQQITGLLGGILGLVMSIALETSLSTTLIFIPVGLIIPILWLNDLIKKRQWQISIDLPFDLDLLTLSVEAGLDFGAAVGKVVEKGREGPLKDEFNVLLNHLKMGETRHEALKALTERIGLSSVDTFAAALIQADRMGTPLGNILRIISSQMRTQRSQRAEKLAAEAPVKLLFPLVFFIFPNVFLVLFGPMVFKIMFQVMQ